MNAPHHLLLSDLPMSARLARARQLVDVQQLWAMLNDHPLLELLEVGCGQRAQFEAGHIPGAAYLDTSALESAPLFNKIDDHALLSLLPAYGIDRDASVVLYSRNPLAPARAAHLLLYAGVADVRLLDGGFAHWLAAAMPCEAGPVRPRMAAADFGAAVPLCPQFMTSMADVRRNTGAPVSVRTWSEFSGVSSGYSYIDARGDIAGARRGRGGREGDVNSMSQYQQPDGRMLPAAAIERMWSDAAIVRGRPSVFYCGTGWRASLAFFYVWLMGWDDISVYHGGWFEWSRAPDNPVVIRIRDSGAAGFALTPVVRRKS